MNHKPRAMARLNHHLLCIKFKSFSDWNWRVEINFFIHRNRDLYCTFRKWQTWICQIHVKFSFSEKATNFWRLLSKCQNHKTDCANFCGLLRKAELYIHVCNYLVIRFKNLRRAKCQYIKINPDFNGNQ